MKIKAVFDELQVKRATHVGGEQIITHAGMKCIRVEELEDVYRCSFLAEQDGEAIANEFSVGSLAQAKECNIVEGTLLMPPTATIGVRSWPWGVTTSTCPRPLRLRTAMFPSR